MRIKRIKTGEPDGMSAPASFITLVITIQFLEDRQEGYRWVNKEYFPATDTYGRVDVYIYYPQDASHGGQEWLYRQSYSSWEDYLLDNESLVMGTRTWDGLPPAHSEDLEQIYVSGQLSTPSLSQNLPTPVPEIKIKKFSPAAFISCNDTQNQTWSYSLVINDPTGKIIRGDTIKFTGPGISCGTIQGNAGLPNYGSWSVQESAPGRVIFVANADVAAPPEGIITRIYGRSQKKYQIWQSRLFYPGTLDRAVG